MATTKDIQKKKSEDLKKLLSEKQTELKELKFKVRTNELKMYEVYEI